jgi:hypothetical protein
LCVTATAEKELVEPDRRTSASTAKAQISLLESLPKTERRAARTKRIGDPQSIERPCSLGRSPGPRSVEFVVHEDIHALVIIRTLRMNPTKPATRKKRERAGDRSLVLSESG